MGNFPEWFRYRQTDDPFITFSSVHLWTIFLFFLGLTLLFCSRHWLKKERINTTIRYLFVFFLIFGELYWYIWKAPQAKLNLASDLPLQLCSISGFIAIYVFLTRQRKPFDFLYYIGIAGGTFAILTPELPHNFPHFHYIGFMLSHITIVYACFFLLWVDDWIPSSKSIIRTFFYLNSIALFVGLINWGTGGNYMYLARKPHYPTLYDYLGPHPWYILSLEIVVLFVCLIMYLPFKRNRLHNSKEKLMSR
ncbi:YwaF family protein [Risungbinella massiliensis]|uniref:YwaF family protein n=1 Tax=Risungbinella massiliensis TaxID=1329796 RepID=UPI0005CBD401|nr:TIGR02206 family membrane protein [Risungbinella massiliensis]